MVEVGVSYKDCEEDGDDEEFHAFIKVFLINFASLSISVVSKPDNSTENTSELICFMTGANNAFSNILFTLAKFFFLEFMICLS